MMEKIYPIKSLRQLKQPKKKFIKTRTGALAVTLFVCISLIASAAVLQYFAHIVMIVNVPQAIKVDGKAYTDEIKDNVPANASGKTFCFMHWINNTASVPVNLNLYKTIKIDNITVDPENETMGLNVTYYVYRNNLTTISTVFGPLLIYETHLKNDKTMFSIRMPRDLINYVDKADGFYWNIVSNNSDMINITFTTDLSGGTWKYNDGSTPEWMTVTGQTSQGQRYFNVTIENDHLGNWNETNDDCGLSYKYNLTVRLSTQENEGYPVVIIKVPTVGYTVRTLGTMTSKIDMAANEMNRWFSICYRFQKMAFGYYTADTKVSI